MRGGRCCNGLVYMKACLFLLALLSASSAECRQQQLDEVAATRNLTDATHDNIDVMAIEPAAASPDDEDKVQFVFCMERSCPVFHKCYSCMNETPDPWCFQTRDDCRNHCPHCHPRCPPPLSLQAATETRLKSTSILQEQNASRS
ncbi:hypothetical protein EJB05_08586 [Eragrostis curvula]|uniref:Embryo surrounding factor 1 brassicaceae domain-containing protein n=1 Tax=Eragrostis curvula TaxID=38414 RepID=A0A5J9W2Q6_9POAL|nr:hypothetical protein EJB05_08586 [Eragrostis curvula]